MAESDAFTGLIGGEIFLVLLKVIAKKLKNAYYLAFHAIVMLCEYLTFVYYTQNIISISNVYIIITHLTSIPT